MMSSKNCNKKSALFASGLICALCFRVPISTAAFCMTRFNLDPSYLNIFITRIVNAMLIGQLFGNWLGVLFTALDWAWKLWVLVVAKWLCLISFSFTMFCFVDSEEGHLTAFYWSVVTLNFFAKVSDAQCLEIAMPDSTNWYVSTFSLSPTYISLLKTLMVKLINWSDEQNTVVRVTAISTCSVKTTVDYRVAKWMILWAIILTALVSVLWSVVFSMASTETGTINYGNIQRLKYVSGIVMGTILTVPGAMLGILISSPTIKWFNSFISETVHVNFTKWSIIIFCTLGALIGFVCAIGVFCYSASDSESWVKSSLESVSKTDNGKNLAIGLGGGVMLGLCFGAIAVRCKSNICKRTVPGLAGGALVGVTLGMLIYEVLTASKTLEPNVKPDEMKPTMEEYEIPKDPQHLKSVVSDLVKQPVENFSPETVEELLKKKVEFKSLPIFTFIKGWVDRNEHGNTKGVNNYNNKWARALQKVDKVHATRTGEWDLSNANMDTSISTQGNDITMEFSFSAASEIGQILSSSEQRRIMTHLEGVGDELGSRLVKVTNVTGEAINQGKVRFTVVGRVNKTPDRDKIVTSVQNVLKKMTKVTHSTKAQWDFKKGEVNVFMGVKEGSRNNQIAVSVNKVSGAKKNDILEEVDKENIRMAVQDLFDRELGEKSFLVEKVEGQVLQDKQIKIIVTLSDSENVWAKTLRKVGNVDTTNTGQWDFSKATVPVCSLTLANINQLKMTANLQGARPGQVPMLYGKNKLLEMLQGIINGAFAPGAVTAKTLTAKVSTINTVNIVFNTENVWTKAIQNVSDVSLTRTGVWNLNKVEVNSSSVSITQDNNITIQVSFPVNGVVGQILSSSEQRRIKDALEEALNKPVNGSITVNNVDGKGTNDGQIVFTVNGRTSKSTLDDLEKLSIKYALQDVFQRLKLAYSMECKWVMKKAEVDLTGGAVTTHGRNIKISVKYVTGAKKGDILEGEREEIKRAVEQAVNKIGRERVTVTKVTGKATDMAEIELTATVERAGGYIPKKTFEDVPTKSSATNSQPEDKLEQPTANALSLQDTGVTSGWISSIIMNVLSLGMIYSVYPGMAPCSITDSSYFNRINTAILILSVIPPTVILYVSETLGGPEEEWEGAAKGWYVGLLSVMVQNICMIIVVFVIYCPDNKFAKIVTLSPVRAGALTVTMVLCQVMSTNIGYAGVVANSEFTMVTFNNTATLSTMVFMSLLGEGYLTELKKYESGMWPTQGMSKRETLNWWCSKAFGNVWLGLLCICTTDLRRNIILSANNNQ